MEEERTTAVGQQFVEGVGRRKEATARVRIWNGMGKFTVNETPIEQYFPRMGDTEAILSLLDAVNLERSGYDISSVVKGGGITGQRDAVLLGLARALVKLDPETKATLRDHGALTRDPREKERKKPGLKRARKAPTYTKR